MTIGEDKVVAITGASSGIGEATARLLAHNGLWVVLGARRTDRLEAIASEIRAKGGSVEYCALDVTRLEDMQAFVEFAKDAFGRIDVMVNNAGLMPLSKLEALKIDEWNRMIDVTARDGATMSAPILGGDEAIYVIENAVTVDSDGQLIEASGGSFTYAAVGSVMSWQAEVSSHLLVFHFPSGFDRALANGRGQDALGAAWLESTGTRFLSALPLPEDTAIM